MTLTNFQSVIFGRGKMTDFWKTISELWSEFAASAV